ncbi:MAG TPA: cupin domain-containing protein [Terriglobia bacterium]|nr:cupin domain-containing protein [Terriglobia bacterium]
MQELEIRRWPAVQPLEESKVAEVWKLDGFNCDVWVDPPGQQWLDFVHSTDERVLVQEGKIEFEVEGARALLGPGDEVFIPAGCRHSVWNRGSSMACWFYGYRRQ